MANENKWGKRTAEGYSIKIDTEGIEAALEKV